MTGRAIIVHDLAQARAILAAAEGLSGEVTLASPMDCAVTHGPPWFRLLLAQAASAYPSLRITGILDCADAPGLALAALREGLRHIVLRGGHPKARQAVEHIAEACGGKVYGASLQLIDPEHFPEPRDAVLAWLGRTKAPRRRKKVGAGP